MKYSEFYLISSDRTNMFSCEWRTDAAPKGLVCLVHGLGEHCGRYGHAALQLVDAGYCVLGFDLPGHGKSSGKRGHVSSYSLLLDNIDILIGEASKRYPKIPCYLYGHSLGGNLVINYAFRNDSRLAGVISTSPWLKLAFEPNKFIVFIGKILDKVYPSFTQSNGLNSSDLSHKSEVKDAYDSDNLVHDRISIRLFNTANESGLHAVENASECKIPILLMHGDSDSITSHLASRQFAKNAGSVCTYKEWEGLYHEIHNEPGGKEVIDFFIGWMQANAKK